MEEELKIALMLDCLVDEDFTIYPGRISFRNRVFVEVDKLEKEETLRFWFKYRDILKQVKENDIDLFCLEKDGIPYAQWTGKYPINLTKLIRRIHETYPEIYNES